MTRFVPFMFFGLITFSAIVSASEGYEPQPLVRINISVEMDAINESLRSTSESIDEMSDSIRLITETDQLDPDQKQHLLSIMENLDQLLDAASDSVNTLPALVHKTRDTVAAESDKILADLKFWSITIIVALFAILILSVAGLYFLALRPLQEKFQAATENISKMADALESTSKSLETSNTIQRKTLKLSETNRH